LGVFAQTKKFKNKFFKINNSEIRRING